MRWLLLGAVLGLAGWLLPVGFWLPLALIPLIAYLWRAERSDRQLQKAFMELVERYHAELDRE